MLRTRLLSRLNVSEICPLPPEMRRSCPPWHAERPDELEALKVVDLKDGRGAGQKRPALWPGRLTKHGPPNPCS